MSEHTPAVPATPLPAATPTMKAILAAQKEGYDHAWQGRNPRACPYDSQAAILRRAWVAGHSAALTDLRAHFGLPADHGHRPAD